MNKINKPSEVPKERHYAVIVYKNTQVHHEESGVWAPGHGYPAYTEEINAAEHYITLDKQDWSDFITELTQPKSIWRKPEPFVAFVVESVAEVTTQVSVKIEP